MELFGASVNGKHRNIEYNMVKSKDQARPTTVKYLGLKTLLNR